VSRIAVVGATGRLGTPICAGIEAADDLTLVARVARSLEGGEYGAFGSLEAALATTGVDVVLEVSGPDCVEDSVRTALGHGIPVVAGATGLDDAAWTALGDLAAERGLPLFQVPNFAIGAVLMLQFAQAAVAHMPDAAIIEEHHATKADRPSGTARLTADLIERAGAPRPRRAPVGDPRGARTDAHDPPRHHQPGGVRPRRAARDPAGARAPRGPHRRARRGPVG
jgi:4-hydroxy-tetrahydrodipicolinate reductase